VPPTDMVTQRGDRFAAVQEVKVRSASTRSDIGARTTVMATEVLSQRAPPDAVLDVFEEFGRWFGMHRSLA
jgi:hypothetical protein